MADFAGTKRQREAEPAVQDVLHYGRLIIHNDPFKDRAPREEDRAFCALFGCGAHIVLIVWNALKFHELTPAGGTMTHLLWTLLYFKTYPSWKTMSKLTNADPKTLRRWIFGGNDYGSNGFAKAISFLEPYVIQWRKRYHGDIGNDCLTSVDGVDFNIKHLGRRFYSHKFQQGSGLRYEVAVSIVNGDLVWLNGPYEPGTNME